MGSLYKRGSVWWCKYYANGRPIRESTGCTGEKEAGRFLKKREGRVADGAPILPRADRIRYDEIAEDLRQHYAATGSRDLEEYTYRVAHVAAFFAGRRVATIGQVDVDAYITKRQEAGVVGSTIRRELGTLRRMLRLAYENGKLFRLPVLRLPKEGAPRSGFFEPRRFEAVRRHLGPDLQVAVTIAYTYGWRMQSEVLTLERRQLDLAPGTLRLDPGATKNDEARVVYLTPELKGLLVAQLERVDALQKRLGRITPYLFPHLSATKRPGKRAGQRRRDFRKAWTAACKAAGCPGMLRHDFRRTAVRNLERAGVPRSWAMKITGHKTEAVYRRYAIVSDADLQEATRRLAGTILGTVGVAAVDARAQVRENPSTGG